MELKLNKTIKGPILIEAFPGVGMVGSITTEYLIDSLKFEEVGEIIIKKGSPLVAFHNNKLIKPITLHYNKKFNLLLIHSITPVVDVEWELCEATSKLIKLVKPKQIVSIDAVLTKDKKENSVFYHATDKLISNKLKKAGFIKLNDGIIMGVTASLISNIKKNYVALFGQTHAKLPDARAASKVILALDELFKLDVDCAPLLKKAEEFEKKLNGLLTKGNDALIQREKKQINYLG